MTGKKTKRHKKKQVYEPAWNDKWTKVIELADKKILIIVSFLILIFIVLFYSSYINSAKFFIQEKNGALHIYSGEFAPDGKKLLVSMPGISGKLPVNQYYNQDQIYPFVYLYYMEKAHILKDTEGMPDFPGIGYYLKKARLFVSTKEEKALVDSKLKDLADLKNRLYEDM